MLLLTSDSSPRAVLEAVVDEVEGLRRTDARSFLPAALVRAARDALGDHVSSAKKDAGDSAALNDINDLAGRTIAHVFDVGLKKGDVVLACTDGTFIALEATGDDEDADVAVVSTYRYHVGPATKLEDYVSVEWLVRAGMVAGDDADRIKREEQERKLREATESVQRARAHLSRAESELAKLQPKNEEVASGTAS